MPLLKYNFSLLNSIFPLPCSASNDSSPIRFRSAPTTSSPSHFSGLWLPVSSLMFFSFGSTLTWSVVSSPPVPPRCGSSTNRPSHEGKDLLKPFFGISLILSRLSCDTDGGQNLMAATSGLVVKSQCNLRLRPCSSHLCGSSWPSLAVSLSFFVYSSSAQFCSLLST